MSDVDSNPKGLPSTLKDIEATWHNQREHQHRIVRFENVERIVGYAVALIWLLGSFFVILGIVAIADRIKPEPGLFWSIIIDISVMFTYLSVYVGIMLLINKIFRHLKSVYNLPQAKEMWAALLDWQSKM
jgi:hypothetical protein